tara:strand:- start:61 stop:399 length:339 start_codon:yes stop_codon:yes gene_type:complete
MGTRLKDIIFDRHEDQLWQDEHAMSLTPYVMAERCLQVEAWKIYDSYQKGDFSTLTYILEGGFKGFHNMDSSELIEEYQEIESKWYQLQADNELEWEPYEDDPIHALNEEKV